MKNFKIYFPDVIFETPEEEKVFSSLWENSDVDVEEFFLEKMPKIFREMSIPGAWTTGMEKVRVTDIKQDCLIFSDGTVLSSYHKRDCCEEHYLDFTHLTGEDFAYIDFNLSKDDFFNRIPNFGIEICPKFDDDGWPIKIPAYGRNNGYYTSDLSLVLEKNGMKLIYDITECQEITQG